MPLSTAQTIGFCTSVLEYMRANKTALDAAGLKIDSVLPDLESKTTTLVSQNEKQERLKAEMRTQTTATGTAQDDAYMKASSTLDAIGGTLGKRTELGKQALRLRSQANMKRVRKEKGGETEK